MAISPTSSSSSSELFFSESENSVDVLLEKQDVIISALRYENENLKKEINQLKEIIRAHLVGSLKTINALFEKVL
jgi:hypothetical protein